MSTVVALPTKGISALTVGRAAELFLDSLANPNTIRGYATAVGKTTDRLGEHRALATVADDEIGEVRESVWGRSAVGTWNARRAAVASWLSWCQDRGDAPAMPGWCKRLATPDSETQVRSRLATDRLVARREVALREKTLYRMLYETAARTEEILGLNIEDLDLDLAARRAAVKAKGARAKTRRRGQTREDVVLETVQGQERIRIGVQRGQVRHNEPADLVTA